MKKYFFPAGLIGILIIAMAQGCESRRSEPLRGALELSNEQVKNGQVLYMAHCQKCHPQGEGGLAPAINSNPAPGFIKRFQVRHGLGVMPSFKADELTRGQLKDISRYLKALKNN
jgi:mono/diheme cytochrome c family protein